MSRSDALYFGDILESIGLIRDFTKGGREEFLQSRLIQEAVARRFEVIGEAVKSLSARRTGWHVDLAWADIAKFRDLIAHHYWRIAPEQVWATIVNDLGPLEAAVRTELAIAQSE